VVKFELDKKAAAAAKPEWAFPERRLYSVSGREVSGSNRASGFLELVARLDFGLYGFRWLQGISPAFVPRKDLISNHRSDHPTGSDCFVIVHFSNRSSKLTLATPS